MTEDLNEIFLHLLIDKLLFHFTLDNSNVDKNRQNEEQQSNGTALSMEPVIRVSDPFL